MSDAVKVQRNGAICEITLDRPKANAIDTAVSQAMYAALRDFDANPEYRVAILTAAGDRFFSAGWDLKAAAAGEEGATDSYSPGGFAGITEFFDLSKPVVAAVNGMAVGGGFEMVLACDCIVAVEHAEFFLPEANVGLVPDAGGAIRLPRAMPRALAMEMLYTGRRLPAREAAQWGLVNRVVSREELMPAARELASRIAAAAPLSTKAIKEMVYRTEGLTVEDAFAFSRTDALPEYQRFLKSEDIEEGARAFAEGREPVWKGR